MKWTSGRRSGGISVCPGDLIAVRLTLDPTYVGPAGEGPADGLPPHLVFVPEFANADPERVGGTAPSSSDPVEFRLNLAPFWVPYRGTLYLDGGLGMPYVVTYSRSCCQPRPSDDPSITLEDVGGTAITLPRNVYAVQAASDCDLEIAHAGNTRSISLAAGQRAPLGQVALGTVKSTGPTIPALIFWVRY